MRDTRGFKEGTGIAKTLAAYVDQAKAKTPGMSLTLPARRNLWGQPIEPRGEFTDGAVVSVVNFLSPAYVKQIDDDVVNTTIVDNNIKIGMPDRKMNIPGFNKAVELTAEEYNRFLELSGKPAKDRLDQMVEEEFFQLLSDGPDGEKAAVIKKTISEFRAQAKAQLLDEFPEIEERALDLEE
jgi:hypothetical protein